MIQVDEKIKGSGDGKASGGDPGDHAEVDPNQTVLKGFEKLVEAKEIRFPNRVRELRLERMMSKAELARQAGLSPLTISRVEEGHCSRLDTKRKILEALGLSLKDRDKVFLDEEK
jgi:DNA-binding XRE family transcriptional regulator